MNFILCYKEKITLNRKREFITRLLEKYNQLSKNREKSIVIFFEKRQAKM